MVPSNVYNVTVIQYNSTKNLAIGCTTSMLHWSPFGGVNQWVTPIAALAFTPSSYISLQPITSTPMYTMEVINSSRRIEKFNKGPNMISLREFKATFSTMVCELKLKYGANYTKAFAFKQLACYVHYEALDVYEQHSPKILASLRSPIQLMSQPSPPPLKLHCNLPLPSWDYAQ